MVIAGVGQWTFDDLDDFAGVVDPVTGIGAGTTVFDPRRSTPCSRRSTDLNGWSQVIQVGNVLPDNISAGITPAAGDDEPDAGDRDGAVPGPRLTLTPVTVTHPDVGGRQVISGLRSRRGWPLKDGSPARCVNETRESRPGGARDNPEASRRMDPCTRHPVKRLRHRHRDIDSAGWRLSWR